MKKFSLISGLIFIFAATVIYQHLPGKLVNLQSARSGTSLWGIPESTNNPSPNSSTAASYKNGTYIGPSIDAFYGYVQVQATVLDGKITDVAFLSYPHDRSTSAMINSQAIPFLKQEAIQSQSAQVDTVSGATDTSEAFRQSLAGALSQAA